MPSPVCPWPAHGYYERVLRIRNRVIGGVIAVLAASILAACGTGGPGQPTHQPNSCVHGSCNKPPAEQGGNGGPGGG